MEDTRLSCTLDGADYKEYQVLINGQPLGLISWKSEPDPSSGSWYTTASDGNIRYFHTQEEAVNFLTDNPLKSANQLSAKLKAEAHKLMDIAEEIEAESSGIEAEGQT